MSLDFSGLTCLIVEDKPSMREILRSMMHGLGFAVIDDASEGAAALAKLRRNPADIVLLDWMMPGMDGIEFLRALRQKGEPLAATIVIMVTAFVEPAKLDQAYASGVDEIVSKPFSARALHGAMEHALTARRPFVTRGDYYGPEMPDVAAETADTAS